MAAQKSMKALVKENKERSYSYKDVPVPVPGPGELLVRPTKVGLCGSDIHFYDWTSVADAVATIPFTPGHEMVAEIVGVGPDVPEDYSVGKRVCVENHFFCGKCYQCKNDQKHICQNMRHYGLGKGTSYGGLSEVSILPARYAYLLKTNISDEEAVLLEPFGVAHQAVESISVKGETVLVLGCGPVGLFAAGIAKCMGASKVIAADVIEKRLEKAKVMGADILINNKTENLKERVYQITDGVGVGCLFEATGVPAVVNGCFELLRKGSSIVLIGLPNAPVQINDPINNLIRKALTLKAICGRKIFHTWEESEMMMHRKEFPVLEAVSHDFALKDFEEFLFLSLGAFTVASGYWFPRLNKISNPRSSRLGRKKTFRLVKFSRKFLILKDALKRFMFGEMEALNKTSAHAYSGNNVKNFLLDVDLKQITINGFHRENKPSRIPIRGERREADEKEGDKSSSNVLRSILKDTSKGIGQHTSRNKSVEIISDKMEVINSSEPGELLEIGDLPQTTDVGAHQVERAEEDNTDSDSEDTLSTISSPSNYFSGPASSVLLAHSKVSPQRGGTRTLVSDLNPTAPLHSLTGVKMADSGYYDASISKSETDIPVRSPLSVNELKYSPALSTSPEPAQEQGDTPGEDHSQHIALDEVGSLLGALQSKCSAQEEEIKSLRSERIKETVATQMSSLNSILAQQEELQKNVHQLNRDLARKKDMIVHLEGKISFLESQSPRSRPPSRDKDSSPSVKYFPGRWTAYRAESKKYSEEMNIICEALEGEGYGPSQVSADEVVRHLWWQRENLRKSGGVAKGVSSTDPDSGDLSKQFEKYETKLADLEENLAKCKDDLELRENVAKETESLLKRQIEENLISRHEAEGEVSTLKGKMAALEQDNILLREKINHLRLEILEYSAKTAKHTRDLASLKREKSSVATELGVLKTERKKATTDIASLRSKLEETEYNFTKSKKETSSLQQELDHTKQSLLNARDELSTTSTEITASKVHCDGLKAKVDNLEEERSRREKWLKELQEDASTLRAQLREKEESRLVVLDKEKQVSAELEGRNKQLMKLEHEKRMIEEKVATSQRELDSRTSELQERENKVWELSRENSLQADELAELNSKLERLKLDKAHADKELQEVNSDLSHVKVKAFEMEQRLCTKTEEVDNLFGKNERLGAKLSMLEDDKLSLSQELAREKHNLASAKEKCGSFERELESKERKHRQEMETQVAKCNHLVMRLSEAQKVCDLVGGENQELQKQIEEMEQSLADSDMQVKKSQEEYLHVTEGLQQQLRTVTEEYNHYQNTSEEIKMELSRKNNDFEAKILALGAELRQRDSTIDVMSSESVGLQSRITALTEDMCKLSEAKSELETRLRDERENAVGSVRRAEEEVEIQKQHVVNLKEELVVAHAASQNIQLKLDHALEENQTLASRLRDAEDKASIVEAEKEELDVQWNKTNKELQQERLNHKEDIAHFEDKLDDIRHRQEREKEMVEQEKATLQHESQSLKDELSFGQQQLSETRRELERVRREVKEEKMKQEEISTKHQMESRKTDEEKDKLKKEIRQEATNLKLSENKVKHLEVSLQTEAQSKMKVQEELQHVQRSKTQLEMDLETEKEKVLGLSKLKAQLEGSIERESVRIGQLNQEVDELVAKSRKLERQLQEEREANESTSRRQSKELHDQRSKYHDEKKALKERIKQLNKECEGSKLQCQQLVANVASLESAHSILSSEKLHLTEEVSRRDELVLRLKEEVRLLEMRNNEFDSQVSQLRKEISVLQRVHIEFEEYKKRLDSTSKAEMQRILSEVTHHMEQQYVAHRNLDKLRLENEGLSLRQKDRKIDKLRNDLKKSQLEGRHDRLHLESLELEADMLRSQKKELDRSRRKLESRLEKINNSLSQSLQEASARNESLASHVTSTPYSNPPSRQRSFLSDLDSHLS